MISLAFIVIEEEHEYIVAYAEDPSDWIVRFEKSMVHARKWAYHMQDLHNGRVGHSAVSE